MAPFDRLVDRVGLEGRTCLDVPEHLRRLGVDITQVHIHRSSIDRLRYAHAPLIDAGAELKFGNVVVAIPSATTFSKKWGEQFAGKDVTLCLDNDRAGEEATRRIAPIIRPYASQLLAVDLKEVA